MRTHRDVNAEGFARRLQEAANARGLTSGRSRSGVDVVALAGAAGASYEMARRYAEGLATPKPDAMRAIASWLGVPLGWLAYGDGDMDTEAEIDVSLLETCLRAVAEAQDQARVSLSEERQAQLIASLYTEARAGRNQSASGLAAMLKALLA